MASRPELEAQIYDHDYLGDAHEANTRRTIIVLILSAVMMVAEIIAGNIYGSMALLADGFHMATHTGALGVAAAAYAFARRHARNRTFSFGTGKVGDLAGFASTLVLGLVAIGIAIESIERFFKPQTVQFGEATIVAIIGLAVNIVSAMLLRGGHGHAHGHSHGAHHGHGHEHDDHQAHAHAAIPVGYRDNNMRSAYLHVIADALVSVLAIVALVVGRYLGWVWLDAAMGVVGSLVILRWSWMLMRETASVLLDVTDPVLEGLIQSAVAEEGGEIRDLHVWRVGPAAHAAILSVSGVEEVDRLRGRLEQSGSLAHVTVELRAS